MNIYEFQNYKKFIAKLFESRPKGGRGMYRQLGLHLNMSSVSISQIFSGDRDLTVEQALETATFLSLNEEETEYFLLLVQLSRSGSQNLRTLLETKIKKIRTDRHDLMKRNPTEAKMNEASQAIFYASWMNSGVRIASSIPGCHSAEAIAKRLRLERADVYRIAEFLVQNGLCVRHPDGYSMGPASTMLPPDSPFVNGHRRNWRLKGLEQLQHIGPQDIFYSGCVSLSKEDLENFRKQFVDMISQFIARIRESDAETMACLNLDWFELR